MNVFSWIIGAISAFCIVVAVSLYAENWYLTQEIKALKDDLDTKLELLKEVKP